MGTWIRRVRGTSSLSPKTFDRQISSDIHLSNSKWPTTLKPNLLKPQSLRKLPKSLKRPKKKLTESTKKTARTETPKTATKTAIPKMATKRKAEEDNPESIPVSAEKIAKLTETE